MALEEFRRYRKLKFMFKNSGGKLKRKHGIYVLTFLQREGKHPILDLYKYTIQHSDLDGLMNMYDQVRASAC